MKMLIAILTITGQLNAQEPSKSVLGFEEFHVLLNAIPVLQPSPEAAYEYACNKTIYCIGDSPLKMQYDAFTEKKEFYKKQLESIFAPLVQDFNEVYSADGYNKLANENDMIKSLGGMDKVMQMTDEEREIAAKKAMASKFSSSRTSSFTEAEVQKMLNDPVYAKQTIAKYNNLSTEEKTTIVNKKIVAGDFDNSKEVNEQRIKDKEITDNAMKINDFMLKTTSQLAQAMEACSLNMSRIKNSSGSHKALDSEYNQLYEKIPLFVNIEGKYRDPGKLKNLNIEYALKHKERSAIELSEVQIEQKKLTSVINEVIAGYQSFLDTTGYPMSGKIINLYNGTNTEMSLMKVEQSIISTIEILANISKEEDELASKHEQHYQLVLTEQ